jgi:hypothetical protein
MRLALAAPAGTEQSERRQGYRCAVSFRPGHRHGWVQEIEGGRRDWRSGRDRECGSTRYRAGAGLGGRSGGAVLGSWVARAVWRGIWQLIAAVLLTVAGLWSLRQASALVRYLILA